MTSKIKVDNINKVSDDSNIIKKCGTTTTIGSGASNPIVVDGSAVTLGRCGGTVALASGATQTGFGRTGTVDWQTGSIKTATFTAANGEGYFANTSGGAFTMNLPAGSAGAIVSVVDYTNTFQTNSLTITPNGSEKIGGVAASYTANTQGQSLTFVYVDGTEGWKNVQDSTTAAVGNNKVVATGGTETTCGDYKIHTFTGPGTFTVSAAAPSAPDNIVDYLVVAGGASGAHDRGGGGGAGGLRYFLNTTCAPTSGAPGAPLNGYGSPTPSGTAITVTAQAYPIVVGGGGTVVPNGNGDTGNVSTFSTVTSAGGGSGGGGPSGTAGGNGGSGGGARDSAPAGGGAGNTPPTTPSQGKDGGTVTGPGYGGGGGGAIACGAGGGGPSNPGGDGAGLPTAFGANGVPCGSYRYYSGGGGSGGPNTAATGGKGGGTGGGPNSGPATAATVNSGGGGGGGGNSPGVAYGGLGGSGIVVIRYKFQ
ncbi:hypothetical protein N9T00_00435 [bacterium]|nr:hypothetical protein [bacterium]